MSMVSAVMDHGDYAIVQVVVAGVVVAMSSCVRWSRISSSRCGHSLDAQVTADKERMAMEVEREEEFLTNKLVKKLDQMK